MNAFLIAPARNNYNRDIFTILDSKFTDEDFSNIRLKDLFDNPSVLPYRIGTINKRDRYYNITNTLCDTLKINHPKGLRYSSCWVPFETIGIECSDHNYVLYEQGIDSIELVGYTIKENKNRVTQKAITEILSNVGQDK